MVKYFLTISLSVLLLATASAQGLKITSGTDVVMMGTTINLVVDDGGSATQGNVEIAAGATLSAAGILSLDGDLINNGSFIENMGELSLTGALDQVLTGSFSFYDITISKLGGNVTLGSPYSINNQLDLISGLVVSDIGSLFTIEETATIVGGSDAPNAAFIDGPLRINTQSATGSQALYFPIGKSLDGFNPITLFLDQTDAVSTTYQVEFFIGTPGGAAPVGISFNSSGFWQTDNTGAVNFTSAKVKLDFEPTDFTLGDKVLVLGNDGGGWMSLGGIEFTAGLDSVTSTIDFTVFDEFTVGSAPLPTVIPEAVSATTSTCEGEEVFLEPEFTGTGPFDIHYHYNTVNGSGLAMNNGDTFSIGSALIPGTYSVTIDSLFDASGCRVTPASGAVSTTPWMVTVNPLPTATLTAPVTICNAEDVNLTFTFPIAATGSTTFDVVVDDGMGTTTTLLGVMAGVAQVITSPGVGLFSYSIISVEDVASTCVQTDVLTFTNTGDIEILALPDGTISGDATICPGDMATLTLDLPDTGGPFDITLSDGSVFTSVPDGGTVQVAPLLDETYTITDIGYTALPACTTVPVTASSTLIQVQQLTAAVTAPFTTGACEGDPIPALDIDIVGTGPFDLFYNIDGAPQTVSAFNAGDQLSLGVLVPGNFVVTLDSISNSTGCTATVALGLITGSWDISVNAKPTASLTTGPITICEGDNFDMLIQITGASATYPVVLDDGLGVQIALPSVADGVAELITPAVAGDYSYTIVSVDDAGCVETDQAALTGTVNVTVLAIPDATIAGATTICAGDVTDLTFTLPTVGGPFDVTLSDGAILTSISNGHVESVNPAATFTYSITSLGYSAVPSCANTGVTSTVEVIVNPLPTVSFTDASITSCPDNEFDLNFSFSGNGPFELVYNNGVSDVTVSGITGTSLTEVLTATANTSFTIVSFTDNNNCDGVIVDVALNLTLTTPPTSMLMSSDPDLQICVGETVTFSTSGAAVYEFYLDGNIVGGPSNISSYTTTATLAEGEHKIRLVAADINKCLVEDELTFTVFPIPGDSFETDPRGQICLGDDPFQINIRPALQGGTLTGSPGIVVNTAGISYSFDPVLATVGQHTITYTVTINGCTGTQDAVIMVNDGPLAAFTVTSTRLFVGAAIAFGNDSSNGATEFSWDFGDGSDPSNQNNPTHTYGKAGVFNVTLTATNATGCIDQFSVPVVIDEFPVQIMNIITPNGDGINDFLYVQDIEFYSSEVLVLNRWGDKVISLLNYNNDPLAWDASSVAAGNYTVLVKVTDASSPGFKIDPIMQTVTVVK